MRSFHSPDDYFNGDFFDGFTFFTGADPTHGFVDYVDQSTAQSNGYINSSSNSVYIGTDSVNKASSSGRESVRITSNKAYDSGLIILDLAHMPGGICGTWPAFWTVGPNWPASGEIDIIEGVNSQSTDAMTLHTSSGCSISKSGDFSGSVNTANCDVNAEGQAANAGCSIDNDDSQTYGAGFNANEGGVYATNYESDAISIYFFPRNSIPSDISSGSPDPSSWGKPIAQFSGDCDINSKINSQQIVFDLTFCGDWAGAVWSTDSTCSAKASSCNDYVQNNPSAFQDAYWEIKGLQVYSANGGSGEGSSTTSNVAHSSTWASSASYGAPSASSVWGASYTPSTTFAVSTKPSPVSLSTGAPVTPPYSSGNETSVPYFSGSGTNYGSAPTIVESSTGVVAPTSVSVASVEPSSAPAEAPSSTEVAASSTETASQSVYWQSRTWHHHHYTPSPQAAKRHLRQHKRHAAGLL